MSTKKLFARWRSFALLIPLICVFSCEADFQPLVPKLELDDMEPQVVAKILALRDSVTAQPRNADFWGRLGMSLYVHELLSEAAQCFENASRLDQNEYRWPYFCAIALHNLGREESLEWYGKAVELNPDEPQLLVRMGNADLAQEKADEAAKHFEKALNLDGRRADAYLGLAQIDYNAENYEQATARLEKTIELQPNLRAAHALLVSCYRMRWMEDKVLQAAARLQQLSPDQSNADPIFDAMAGEGVSFQWLMERGEQLLQAGQAMAAVAEFRRAIGVRPEASAYSKLGVALSAADEPDSAVSAFRKAYKLGGRSHLHTFNLGLALCNNDSANAGILFLERAYQLAPDKQVYAPTLFDQYVRTRRWKEAVQLGSTADISSPKRSDLALKYAWLLATCPDARIRNGARAIEIAETVSGNSNGANDSGVFDCLAAAYAEAGRFDRAAGTIEEAIKMAGTHGQNQIITHLRERREQYLQEHSWTSDVPFPSY